MDWSSYVTVNAKEHKNQTPPLVGAELGIATWCGTVSLVLSEYDNQKFISGGESTNNKTHIS